MSKMALNAQPFQIVLTGAASYQSALLVVHVPSIPASEEAASLAMALRIFVNFHPAIRNVIAKQKLMPVIRPVASLVEELGFFGALLIDVMSGSGHQSSPGSRFL